MILFVSLKKMQQQSWTDFSILNRIHSLSLRPFLYRKKTHHCDTLLGPCFKTGGKISKYNSILWVSYIQKWIQKAHNCTRVFTTQTNSSCTTLLHSSFPFTTPTSNTFHNLFKSLFIFRSRYFFAIGLPSISSFRWNIPPNSSCNLKQPDSSHT